MSGDFTSLRNKPSFGAALIVPVAIMLIFSFFNLIAVADPSLAVSNAKYGLVVEEQNSNGGEVERIITILKNAFPFASADYADKSSAADALATGEILASLILPAEFGAQLKSPQPATIEINNVTHLTLVENQLSTQIANGLQAAMGGAVLTQRLVTATGAPPARPIVATTTSSTASMNPIAKAAPGIATFVIWLSAFVGSVLIFLTVRGEGANKSVMALRLIAPLAVSGISSLVLAAVISLLLGDGALLIKLWGLVWLTVLGLAWLFTGLFAWLGPLAIVIILPFVFLQTALGGAMAPLNSIPDWLQWIAGLAPFQIVGETLRATILTNDLQLPWQPALISMAVGLVLIVSRSMIGKS